MLPPEAIEEYRKLYKQRYGVDLSGAEASFRANNLVRLYRATLGTEQRLQERADDKDDDKD